MNEEQLIRTVLNSYGIHVPDSAYSALATHFRLLFSWNKRFNLTAIRSREEVAHRHVAEALEALPWVVARPGAVLIDLGSGNGYPALPLLAAAPELHGVLFEARDAKAAFLRAVIREAGLAARVRVDQQRLPAPDAIPAAATIVTLRGFPEPGTWIAGALQQPAVRLVLAWLARADAEAVTHELGRGEMIPLRTHAGSVLLVAGD